MKKQKFFITTTFARTLFFFSGQPEKWQKKFDVCAIAAEKEKLLAFAQQEGIRYRYMPMHREISFFSDIGCLFRFIWFFLKERPYIVHGNTPKASMLSMVAAWLTRRPVRIYMCHGLRYQTTSGLKLKLLRAMEWMSCHCATIVIGVSQGVVTQLISDGLCPKGKAKIVGYGTAGGIDTSTFSREAIADIPDLRINLDIPKDAFVFCFIGRIVKDKGINELISAFSRLSEKFSSAYLLLIGPQEKDLDPINDETLFLIHNNAHIIALGRQKDVRPYLRASNALVLPSYREGVGQVLLEANAMDIPCIASDIIGCHDVIMPLKNGELVEARNANALYEKMEDWLKDSAKVGNMASRCRQFVLKRYDKDYVKIAYYNEYCRLAETNLPSLR